MAVMDAEYCDPQRNLSDARGEKLTYIYIFFTERSPEKERALFKTLRKGALYDQVILLIVSIAKFSIVIGSPRAYVSDLNVNYARFNGFLSNACYSFQNLGSKEVLRRHF